MSQTTKTVLISAIVGLVSAFIGVTSFTPSENVVMSDTKEKESVYDRVMRTKTIRCGYALWPGLIEKEPNSGELYGTFVDYMDAMSDQLSMKVEWSEELGFGNFIEALNNNRIDAMCSGVWTNSARGSIVDFTIPISYQGVTAFVRADDTRFDYNLGAINDDNVTAVGIEGGTSQEIVQNFFPETKLTLLPQLSEAAQMLLNVTTKKADVTFTDRHTIQKFLESNPGQLREVPAKYPVRLFGNPLAVKKGEYAFKQTLDNATLQLIHTGVIESILTKHEKYPNTFYRPAPRFINAE